MKNTEKIGGQMLFKALISASESSVIKVAGAPLTIECCFSHYA
ncbi:unnamed protein product, partial [Larinioides sclopetarius]